MKARTLLLVLGLAVLLPPARSEEKPKPRCNAQTRGMFWPDEANSNPRLAQVYARSGELEMCTLQIWRHRWEPVTVHVRQLEARQQKERRTARDAQPAGGGD